MARARIDRAGRGRQAATRRTPGAPAAAAVRAPRRPLALWTAAVFGLLLFVLMPDQARGWNPWPDLSPADMQTIRTPIRTTIAGLRQLQVPPHCTVLDLEGGLGVYLPGEPRWLNQVDTATLVEFLEQRRPDVVIMGPMMLNDWQGKEPALPGLRRGPGRFGYVSREAPGCIVLIRREALK